MMSILPITIAFTYFKSLTMLNFEASLKSVAAQDMDQVESIVIVDNDSPDSLAEIWALVNDIGFKVPVNLLSYKHGDKDKTHSWSANTAVRRAYSPWVFFTRADYLLDPSIVSKFADTMRQHPQSWTGFITSQGKHLDVDVTHCLGGLAHLPGSVIDYTKIDSGVWMTRRDTFESAGGFNENLTAWGHQQTLFQHAIYELGTEFVCLPEVLFYHPLHSAPRDIEVSHKQLWEAGHNIRDLWARHEGAKPY